MLTVLVLAVAVLEGFMSSPDVGHTVLISGYNKKLNVFNITGLLIWSRIFLQDNCSGDGHIVTKVSELEVDGSLSWLQVEGDLLYGSHEDSSLVSRWRLNRGFTQLERLERVEMPGSGPAHLTVDRRLVTSSF